MRSALLEVMVEGLTHTHAPTQPIDPEPIGAVDNDCEADLKPVRPGRHVETIPYGMVWNVKAVTVIGGGLGGLAAAITAAEAGASVTLHTQKRSADGGVRRLCERR